MIETLLALIGSINTTCGDIIIPLEAHLDQPLIKDILFSFGKSSNRIMSSSKSLISFMFPSSLKAAYRYDVYLSYLVLVVLTILYFYFLAILAIIREKDCWTQKNKKRVHFKNEPAEEETNSIQDGSQVDNELHEEKEEDNDREESQIDGYQEQENNNTKEESQQQESDLCEEELNVPNKEETDEKEKEIISCVSNEIQTEKKGATIDEYDGSSTIELREEYSLEEKDDKEIKVEVEEEAEVEVAVEEELEVEKVAELENDVRISNSQEKSTQKKQKGSKSSKRNKGKKSSKKRH